jgi:hypothetical protein
VSSKKVNQESAIDNQQLTFTYQKPFSGYFPENRQKPVSGLNQINTFKNFPYLQAFHLEYRMQLLTELHYHPSIAWFQNAVQAEEILLESQEHYQKQSYRNRCHILSAQGVIPLSVPVKNGNKKIKATDVEIEYEQRWVDVHWRTIRSAYGNAPYFEFYGVYLQAVYEKKPKYLFQLNLEFLKLYLKFLKWKTPLGLTERYETHYPAPVLDLRNAIHPKRQPDNLDIKEYAQVFGKQFAPNLSILDLLFNLGPEASHYLQNR